MAIKVETPPTFAGETEEKLKQMIGYLFRLSENLNVALNNLTTADIKEPQAADVSPGGGGASSGVGDVYNELRSLIINTASYVRKEEQRLEEEYTSRYTAMSNDWGLFQENIKSSIETTARGIINSFDYDSKIETLQEQAAGFSEYQLHTESFIQQGFVDFDETGVPIVGIAIGQNLISTEVTVDGEKYNKLDQNQSCAFYTADKVSFRINGQEVAYVSNRKLYIGDAAVNGVLTFGDQWQISRAHGLTFKWIGG